MVALFGVFVFMVSIFMVAGVNEPNPATRSTVIAALAPSVILLFVQIWNRVGQADAAPEGASGVREVQNVDDPG